MSKRAWKINLFSLVVILLFGILLAERYQINLDLTESKIYTLSEATKRILKDLKEPVIIKVFFSKKIPSPYNTNTRYAYDLIRDYRRLSDGKIVIDRIDPAKKERFESLARTYGIPPVQVNVIENEQVQIKRVFMGLAFLYGDRIEIIPVVEDISNLEYQISSTIKSLLQKKKKSVGIVTGHGERPLLALQELLRKRYDVRTVDLQKDDLRDFQLLIIAGPKEKFKEEEIQKIDQFIMKNGKVFFLLDRVSADLHTGFGRTLQTGLEDLLKHYGIVVKDSLVIDLSSGIINVSERKGGFVFTTVVRYPFFPKILNLNKNHIITKDLETIQLGYTSPIETEKKKDVEFIVLARTSRHSGLITKPYFVSVQRNFKPEDFQGPSSVVALLASGKFTSKYQDKKDFIKEGQSRFIVVGDSDFVSRDFLGAPGNLAFVLNSIDWLLEDDSLISIRSKDIQARPIKELSPSLKRIVKYTIFLIPPIATVITGISVWMYRRRKRIK